MTFPALSPGRMETPFLRVYEKVVGKRRKKEYPHLYIHKNQQREDALLMKTNDALKSMLVQQAEEEIQQMMEQMHEIAEGNMKDLEQHILKSSLMMGKKMMEQVLQYAQGEEKQPTRRDGSCGHRQRVVGNRSKQVLTMMGEMTIQRQYYQCLLTTEERASASCSHGEAPFDAVWGLSAGRTTPGVQKLVGYLTASMTLSEATSLFTSLLPLPLSDRQALNLVQAVGDCFLHQEDEAVRQVFEQPVSKERHQPEKKAAPEKPVHRLYIELDGVMARLRRGSVSMEEQERKRTGDVYREVKVGAVFEAIPGRKRSALVEGVFVDEPGDIRYVVRRTHAEAFGRLLYHLAQTAGVERAEQVIVLGDGAAWIRRLVAEHFPQALHIIDVYHAKEHLWKVANAVYGAGTPEAAVWAKTVDELVTSGEIIRVVERIEALGTSPSTPETVRSVLQTEAAYFRGNVQRMQYPLFRAQGLHIGSGIAEAACKTVVSTRAKRSGMRWTPKGLDAILALRTAVLNHTYEPFWHNRFHRIA